MATKKPRKAAPVEKVKTTLYISPEVKRRLSYAKADLRASGIATTESQIMEALVLNVETDQLAKWLK
ncbi:MAG TPA: hypothetical protein VII69_07140 [Candidatus Eremiobacteraceae bacterium]